MNCEFQSLLQAIYADDELSIRARTLLVAALVADLPPAEWDQKRMEKVARQTAVTTHKATQELRERGYLRMEAKVSEGGRGMRSAWYFSATPQA